MHHLLRLQAIMGLRWVSEHCRNVKFILKSDDDVFVDVFSVLRHLRHLATGTLTPPDGGGGGAGLDRLRGLGRLGPLGGLDGPAEDPPPPPLGNNGKVTGLLQCMVWYRMKVGNITLMSYLQLSFTAVTINYKSVQKR